MPVEVVHTFEEKGKSVNVATEMLEYRLHS